MNIKTELLKIKAMGFDGLDKQVAQQMGKLLSKDCEIPLNLDSPRLVNRFTLGADPEFAMYDSANGVNVAASSLGLDGTSAYGADGSGRPVELRPHPSRFAVEVVASLLATLRAMANHLPQSTTYDWLTGAMVNGWPIGGHVHIAKKQDGSRDIEVAGLDQCHKLLEAAGVLNIDQCQRRRNGGSYGRYGEHRNQAHGYEYRTFPSWLGSIGQAHLVLTTAKLAARDHKLWAGVKIDSSNGLQYLTNILAAYRYLDDDAALAYRGLKHTLVQSTSEFKSRWGIPKGYEVHLANRSFMVPATIKPCRLDIEDVVAAIVSGEPPVFRLPTPQKREEQSMAPREPRLTPPTGWQRATVAYEDHPFPANWVNVVRPREFENLALATQTSSATKIYVPIQFLKLLDLSEVIRLQDAARSLLNCDLVARFGSHNQIMFPESWLVSQQSQWEKAFRLFTMSNFFPFAHVTTATEAKRTHWIQRLKTLRKRGG